MTHERFDCCYNYFSGISKADENMKKGGRTKGNRRETINIKPTRKKINKADRPDRFIDRS